MITYPVPFEEYRDYNLVYAVLRNGKTFWHWPETGRFEPLTPEEYEQYEATYPSGSSGDIDNEDAESTASSEFISNPEEPEEEELHPSVTRPVTPMPPSASPPQSPPSSPYRRRATPDSWTGLEITSWGIESYIDPAGRMAVRHETDAQTGVYAGYLSRCTWVGWESREDAPVSLGPELKLTTPEGKEYWLDDQQQYEYEFHYDEGRFFGHICDERCEWFREGGDDGYGYVEDEAGYAVEDLGYGHVEYVEEEAGYAAEDMEAKVMKDLEGYVVEDSEDEDEDVVEIAGQVHGLLAQIQAATEAEKTGPMATGAAGEDLPRWVRDPSYIENRDWADMDDEYLESFSP